MSAPLAVLGQAAATGSSCTSDDFRNLRVSAVSTGNFDSASSASKVASRINRLTLGVEPFRSNQVLARPVLTTYGYIQRREITPGCRRGSNAMQCNAIQANQNEAPRTLDVERMMYSRFAYESL